VAKKITSIWEKAPSSDDLNNAAKYLNLVLDQRAVRQLISKFRKAAAAAYKAKDLLRASDLPLLDKDDTHVAEDLKRINKKKKLSSVLLVRGNVQRGIPMTIADGYRRICASYHWDKACPVACLIVSA
jgi:hypothetical protein